MRERIAEIASRAGELAEIRDAWILSRIKQLADSSLANFLLFDADGKLVVDGLGHPVIDLSQATRHRPCGMIMHLIRACCCLRSGA